jgi:outer membrane protein TolC
MIMRTKVLLWLGLVVAQAAHAQAPSLNEAVEQAWQRTRQADVQAARSAELDARERVNGAWFPESPTVGADVRRDLPRWAEPFGAQQGSERGMNEWEVGVSVPLWLPGQRDAQGKVITGERAESGARATADRLVVAGEVREALWSVVRTRSVSTLAAARRDAAQALERDVARRVAAGDLARTDLLLAQSELLASRAALAQAEADERGALEVYALLVGVRALPRDALEDVPSDAALEGNPALVAALERIAASRARLDLAQTVRRDSPTLSIVPRFEREVDGGDYRNTVRVGIAIPLDTDVRNAPRIAAASTAYAEAQVAALAVKRSLETALARARNAVDAAAAQAAIAESQRAVADENLQLIDRAFRLGERGLVDLLRVRAIAREAQIASELARSELGLARARLNQTLGVMP